MRGAAGQRRVWLAAVAIRALLGSCVCVHDTSHNITSAFPSRSLRLPTHPSVRLAHIVRTTPTN